MKTLQRIVGVRGDTHAESNESRSGKWKMPCGQYYIFTFKIIYFSITISSIVSLWVWGNIHIHLNQTTLLTIEDLLCARHKDWQHQRGFLGGLL